MDLNITNYTPLLPNSYSIESYNSQGTKPESKSGSQTTGVKNDPTNQNAAAIISFSPEALNKSPASGNLKEPETSSKIGQDPNGQQLSLEEKHIVQKLQQTDLHVKMHEQQHLAAAGSYAKGGPSFHYTKGPDGKLYAVGGEVALDTSPIAKNPQATIVKAQILRRAALAPSDPSGADRAIAAAATQMEAQARNELAKEVTKKSGFGYQANNEKAGNTTHYYIKAYRHSIQFHCAGNYFNKIA